MIVKIGIKEGKGGGALTFETVGHPYQKPANREKRGERLYTHSPSVLLL